MSFANYYNDMSNIIVESKTGQYLGVDVFGHNSKGYFDGELNPINVWAFDRIDESLEYQKTHIGLINPLYIKYDDFTIDNTFFVTQCVGYSVEHEYDSVVIESNTTTFVVTIDFDDHTRSLNTYMCEAPKNKPLSGVKISKVHRKEHERRKHANKPKPGSVTRPKKSPPQGIKIDVLLANTGKLSPERVQRGMKNVRKNPPKITAAKEVQDIKYFRVEYNFKSAGSNKNQTGYADISQNKTHCNELFCSCSDFFYRLYAPYVAAGLSTWSIPSKFKSKQNRNVLRAPHNHHWTVSTNPQGKLFLCKHLWAFLAYYVTGSVGNVELSDEDINAVIKQYFDDIDGDGEEEAISTDFEKAFGKLYMANAGKDKELQSEPNPIKSEPKRIFSKLGDKEEETLEPENQEEKL